MVTSRQLRILATNPAAMMAFQIRGRLPQGIKPASPLLAALRRIAPMDRSRMLGFVIGVDLGYQCAQRFPSVAHAMHWLAPAEEVFGSFPAEACRLKAFSKALSFEDVASACQTVPDDVIRRYGNLSALQESVR